MFCSKCGNQVHDNEVSCPICGYNFKTVPVRQEAKQEKSNKGLKITVVALAVIAVAAIVIATLAFTGVLGSESKTEENSITKTEEKVSQEADISHLSDEEQISILLERHLSYVVNRDAERLVDSVWECSVAGLKDEFIDDQDFVNETELYYFDSNIREIKNIETTRIEIEELTQDQKDKLRDYAEELIEEGALKSGYSEVTRSAGAAVTCDVVYADGTEGQQELGFLLYERDGEWKIVML